MSRSYIFKEKALNKESFCDDSERKLFSRLSRNTMHSKILLCEVLGLSQFIKPDQLPSGFRRNGAYLYRYKEAVKYNIFSFGKLRGAKSNSLVSFFRLAVYVMMHPREDEKFYCSMLSKRTLSRQKNTSSAFIKKWLPLFKSQRAELIREKKISANSKKWVLIDACVLCSSLIVCPSNDQEDHHPFAANVNKELFNKLLQEFTEEAEA